MRLFLKTGQNPKVLERVAGFVNLGPYYDPLVEAATGILRCDQAYCEFRPRRNFFCRRWRRFIVRAGQSAGRNAATLDQRDSRPRHPHPAAAGHPAHQRPEGFWRAARVPVPLYDSRHGQTANGVFGNRLARRFAA